MKTLAESLLSKSKITTAVANQDVTIDDKMVDWIQSHFDLESDQDIKVYNHTVALEPKFMVQMHASDQDPISGFEIPDFINWRSWECEVDIPEETILKSFKNFPKNVNTIYLNSHNSHIKDFTTMPKKVNMLEMHIGEHSVNAQHVQTLKGLEGHIEALLIFNKNFEEFKSSNLYVEDLVLNLYKGSKLKNLMGLPTFDSFIINIDDSVKSNDLFARKVYDYIREVPLLNELERGSELDTISNFDQFYSLWQNGELIFEAY